MFTKLAQLMRGTVKEVSHRLLIMVQLFIVFIKWTTKRARNKLCGNDPRWNGSLRRSMERWKV